MYYYTCYLGIISSSLPAWIDSAYPFHSHRILGLGELIPQPHNTHNLPTSTDNIDIR